MPAPVRPKNKEFLSRAVQKDEFLDLLEGEFDLEKILLLDDEYYERVVYPIMHNYIRDLDIFRRNAAVALGTRGIPDMFPRSKRRVSQRKTRRCSRQSIGRSKRFADLSTS